MLRRALILIPIALMLAACPADTYTHIRNVSDTALTITINSSPECAWPFTLAPGSSVHLRCWTDRFEQVTLSFAGGRTCVLARADLRDWCAREEWFRPAKPDAKLMHCLPVRRNVEIADELLDGPRSVVIQEAGNRLHVQKAILATLANS